MAGGHGCGKCRGLLAAMPTPSTPSANSCGCCRRPRKADLCPHSTLTLMAIRFNAMLNDSAFRGCFCLEGQALTHVPYVSIHQAALQPGDWPAIVLNCGRGCADRPGNSSNLSMGSGSTCGTYFLQSPGSLQPRIKQFVKGHLFQLCSIQDLRFAKKFQMRGAYPCTCRIS